MDDTAAFRSPLIWLWFSRIQEIQRFMVRSQGAAQVVLSLIVEMPSTTFSMISVLNCLYGVTQSGSSTCRCLQLTHFRRRTIRKSTSSEYPRMILRRRSR